MTKTLTSVFVDSKTQVFTTYDVELTFRERLAGSVPSEPTDVAEMIQRRWKKAAGKSGAEITREELARRMRLFMMETGKDVEGMEDSEVLALAKQTASSHINVFRRDEGGLYFPASSIKAAIKESVNILYATRKTSERWGPTGKSPKSFLVERVFVDPDRVRLLRDGEPLQEADGIEVLPGVVEGAGGKRSIITQHEYVERVVMQFQLNVLIPGNTAAEMAPRWPDIFRHMEANGMGGIRKYTDYGLFVTTAFTERKPVKARTKRGRRKVTA